MFHPRDTRMPRQPDVEMEDFIIDILTKDKDPLGILGYLDTIVSVERYTNREFNELMDDVFEMADAFLSSRSMRDCGEAVAAAVNMIAADMAVRERARFLDDLPRRDYDDVLGIADNYGKMRRAMEDSRGGGRGRGRDDRDDRGRDRDRFSSRHDRGGRDDRDRRHPDDIRAERAREAERERGRGRGRDDRDERRSRRDEPRAETRAEPRRDDRSSRRGRDEPQQLTPAKAKQLLAEMEMAIWRHLSESKDNPDRLMSADELKAIGIEPELFLKVGGKVAEPSNAAEVRGAVEAERPFPESARHAGQNTASSETELNRSSRRAEAQRQSRQQQESIVEPVAFEEVFQPADQVPVVAQTRASDPIPAAAELVAPSIDPSIDYNANITTRGVKYATGEARPEWDPLVPTLKQWEDAGFDVSDKMFIASLPPLPVVRGFGNHQPAVFDPERWVPTLVATPDGYRMESFRERDMNKDDILIPNFGSVRRKEHVANGFVDAAKKTTRFDPLAVAAEVHGAKRDYDDEVENWKANGSDPANEPQAPDVDTKRHGQMMRLAPTIHATTMQDAVIRMHAMAGAAGVGLDETGNIMANVELHSLLGVCTSDEEYAAVKQALGLFTRNGAGAHLTIPQLWRSLVEAKTVVPFAIWKRLDRLMTDAINEIIRHQMTMPLTVTSFADSGDSLVDIIAEKAGRYMAETVSRHSEYISRALRGVSFEADENLGDVKWGVWFIVPRRVVYANATLAELNLAATDTEGLNMLGNDPVNYTVNPEQNLNLLGALDRLMSDVRNTVGANAEALSEVVLDILTLDDYCATITQNWLSNDLYLSMAVRRV